MRPRTSASANDAGTSPSGVAKVEVSIQRASDSQYWNGSSWQAAPAWNLASGTTSWSYGFSPAADNQYTVVSKATDKATNVETPGAGHSFKVDDLAPTSSDNADANWHNSAVTVHLSASDPGFFPSGVASITYSVDGGAPTTVSGDNTDVVVPAPSNHSNDGVHSISYYASDNASNEESPHNTATVKIDTSQPNSAITFPTDGTTYSASGWSSGCSSSICGTAADAPATNAFNANSSGVNKVEVSIQYGGMYWDDRLQQPVRDVEPRDRNWELVLQLHAAGRRPLHDPLASDRQRHQRRDLDRRGAFNEVHATSDTTGPVTSSTAVDHSPDERTPDADRDRD